MNKLYEVLEICLEDIEQGADIDTVLFRYPDLADELRPILEASVGARNMAAGDPAPEVVRRNRVKVLQQTAHLREARMRSTSRRRWLVSLRRVAVTLVVVALLFVSGTTLVRAASTTVPGDNLYPVKRTWEDVLLLFTFNVQQREALELEHENERLHELRELFAEGRSEDVEFAGIVTSQNGNEWVVSPGITVLISVQTELRAGPVAVGDAVRVEGETQDNMAVVAEQIELLPPGATLPELEEDEDKEEEKKHEDATQLEGDSSGKGALVPTPNVEPTKRPGSNSKQQDASSTEDGSGSDSQEDDKQGEEDKSQDSQDDSGGEESSSEEQHD